MPNVKRLRVLIDFAVHVISKTCILNSLESLRYKYTSRRVLQRERMTSSLAFLSNSVRQATSSQREKLVLQVKTKREGLSQFYTIKSSFSIINC